MNDGGDCRKAPATLGLLMICLCKFVETLPNYTPRTNTSVLCQEYPNFSNVKLFGNKITTLTNIL